MSIGFRPQQEDSGSELSLGGYGSGGEEEGVEVVDGEALSRRVVRVRRPFDSKDNKAIGDSSRAGRFRVRFYTTKLVDEKGRCQDPMVGGWEKPGGGGGGGERGTAWGGQQLSSW